MKRVLFTLVALAMFLGMTLPVPAAVLAQDGGVYNIVIAPDTASMIAGEGLTYSATAYDQGNNSLGNVTGNTTFSITAGAGGSWSGNVYTSQYAGNWTVTGTYEGKSDNATLVVNVGACHRM